MTGETGIHNAQTTFIEVRKVRGEHRLKRLKVKGGEIINREIQPLESHKVVRGLLVMDTKKVRCATEVFVRLTDAKTRLSEKLPHEPCRDVLGRDGDLDQRDDDVHDDGRQSDE